jgi:hypothetical protein
MGRRRNSVGEKGNAANLVDVSPGNGCVGVGGCPASPARASPGRTRQGLALRTVESTTGAHSERLSESLWFYWAHADHTGLANQPKPVFHLVVVKEKKARRVARLAAAFSSKLSLRPRLLNAAEGRGGSLPEVRCISARNISAWRVTRAAAEKPRACRYLAQRSYRMSGEQHLPSAT